MAIPISNSVALLIDANDHDGSLVEEFVSGLTQGGAWTFVGPQTLTYSLNINERSGTYPGTPVPGPGGAWGAEMTEAVARGLTRWAEVANIGFQRITSGAYYFESNADLAIALTGDDLDGVFGASTLGAAMFPDAAFVEERVYRPSTGLDRNAYPGPEGDIFFDNYDQHFEHLAPGRAGFAVILHEIGHALGLKHPHDDGGNAGRPTFEDLGIESMDRMRHTVMSYGIAVPPAEASGFAATPMPLDILAIQHIYGANLSHRTGDDTYKLRNASFRTVWDAGGEDWLSAASWSRPDGVRLDLRGGEFSGNLAGVKRMAIAYGAIIENAVGSDGADRIIGNDTGNILRGREGDDVLWGFAGRDDIAGGRGADRLEGGEGNDFLSYGGADVSISGGSGFDTLRLGGSLDLREVAGRQVSGFERISMEGGKDGVLTVDAQALLDLSPARSALTVLGDAGDTVALAGSYSDEGVIGNFHRYRLGAGVLLVESEVDVV